MALAHPVVLEGLRYVARQAVSSGLITDPGATVPPPTQTISLSAPTAANPGTSSTPSETPVNGGNPGGNGQGQSGGGGNSSPLLFFVALGFGVVFTNLWIIVGVKYCFRYNARSRQMRMNEDGEPINLENMPRPHRRRREKKLMTMDEVNEKFPMQKYKNWVSTRAQEGLPTQGGVSVPNSRPGSLRNADGIAPELPSKERASVEDRPTTSATAAAVTEKKSSRHANKESTSSAAPAAARTSTDARLVPVVSESATLSKDANRASHDDDEEDDEHINAALPPECMGTSGDTCAICIDSLEDDDDVRGLTCGHAFHAVCLDPWLTSRRACCPLCKADYYTPKPRAAVPEAATGPGETGVITVTLPGDSRRMNMPSRPRTAFMGFRRSQRSGTNRTTGNGQGAGSPYSSQPPSPGNRPGLLSRLFQRDDSSSHPAHSPTNAVNHPDVASIQPQTGGIMSTFRTAFPTFRARSLSQGRNEPTASGANAATVTPSNLEAGIRNTSN